MGPLFHHFLTLENMKTNLWSQLINTFEVNTRGSRRKMLRIAYHHYSRLQAMKADPIIMALLVIFEPAFKLYQNMFSNLDSQEGLSMGNTAKFTSELDNMSDYWFDEWQTMVRQVFETWTPEFKAVFPRGKEPFQRIQYDLRMVAVEGLYKTLLTYPVLKDAAENVAAKLVLLNDARNAQTESFGTNAFTASMLEEQRIVLANLLDDNLCDLKKKYRSNIKMVENFFDLSELRKPSSDSDSRFMSTGSVEAGATTAIRLPDKLKMSTNADTVFVNRSNQVELLFFYSANASASDNPVKAAVLAMQSVQTTAADAGWGPGAKYLIVKNAGTVTAEFELQVTEMVES